MQGSLNGEMPKVVSKKFSGKKGVEIIVYKEHKSFLKKHYCNGFGACLIHSISFNVPFAWLAREE